MSDNMDFMLDNIGIGNNIELGFTLVNIVASAP